MAKVDIIVPHDKIAVSVIIDGLAAIRVTTHTGRGSGFDTETWEADDNGPYVRVVSIRYEPRL